HPGTYHGAVNISSTVVFDSGVYVFCHDLSLQSAANLSGTGVMLYLAQNAGLSISGQASIAMSAPSSGSYAGLLIWLPSTNSTNNLAIAGGASVNTYAGAIYAPNADVQIGGGTGVAIGMVVARTVTFTGGGTTTVGVGPPAISSP